MTADDPTTAPDDWPFGYGFCHCGCGERTKIADRNRYRIGHRKGEPVRFLPGHGSALTAASFWARVDKSAGIGPNGDCWEWRGAKANYGYGIVEVRGKRVRAHRHALIASGTNVPDDAIVMHSCDNPCCVRPSHLKVDTQLANMTDAAVKLRVAKRLTPDQVRAIRSLRAAGQTQAAVAHLHGVHKSTVKDIDAGRIWKHV